MKRVLSILMSLFLVISMVMPVSAEDGGLALSRVQEYVEGELIVAIEKGNQYSIQNIDGMDPWILEEGEFSIKDSILGNIDFSTKDSLIDINYRGRERVDLFSEEFKDAIIENMGYVYLVEYSSKYTNPEEAAYVLRQDLEDRGLKVKSIEPNYISKVFDVHPSQRWQYDMIKAPQAWGITQGSSNVKVAVLDTGIDYNHQSLRNFVNTGLGRDFTNSQNGFMDSHGHGTHCAGTIASYGNVSGVMQNASLIPVKVLGNDGRGTNYGITQGILYAGEIGADVISMSLGGGGYDNTMYNACQTVMSRGTVVVAATGNDGVGSISYPAAYNGVIAVGSVDSAGRRSSFSNYGSGLDVMAPGSNVYSTAPNNRYVSMSGTSMACPHVAGVVGLMRAANGNITVDQVRNILTSTAQRTGDQAQYGYGIVDAYEAVRAAGGGTIPIDKNTNTTVTTDKTDYTRGENSTITVRVTDQDNRALSGASINLVVTRPNGTTIPLTETTNTSGVATFTITSNAQTALGTYRIVAQASATGYVSSSGETSIRFVDSTLPIEKNTNTAVTTNKTDYVRGESSTITVRVTDQDNRLLYGATVNLVVTRPNGTTIPLTATTNTSGVATFTITSNAQTALGTYRIVAQTSATGYVSSSAETYIRFR